MGTGDAPGRYVIGERDSGVPNTQHFLSSPTSTLRYICEYITRMDCRAIPDNDDMDIGAFQDAIVCVSTTFVTLQCNLRNVNYFYLNLIDAKGTK